MRWSASKNFLYVKRDKRPQFEQWWKEEEEWRGENKIIRFKQPILISLESHSEKLRMKRIFYFHFYSFSISLSLSLSPQIRFVRHHWLAISWGCEIIFNCQRENTIKNLNSAHPYRRHYRRHKRDNSRNRKSCLLTGSIIITFNKSILVNLVSGIIGINPSRIRRILCKFVGIWIKLHAERERAREIYKIVSNFGIIFDH